MASPKLANLTPNDHPFRRDRSQFNSSDLYRSGAVVDDAVQHRRR
jgi:hypothetical protein